MDLHPLVLAEFEESRKFREEVRDNLLTVNVWIARQDAAAETRKSYRKLVFAVLGLIVTIVSTVLPFIV